MEKEVVLKLTVDDIKNIDRWILDSRISPREAAVYLNLINKINKQLGDQLQPLSPYEHAPFHL